MISTRKRLKILQGMRREISVGLQSNMGPLTAVRHTINWLEELQYHSHQLTWYIRTLWVSFRPIFIFIGPRPDMVFPCHSVNALCQLPSELLHVFAFFNPFGHLQQCSWLDWQGVVAQRFRRKRDGFWTEVILQLWKYQLCKMWFGLAISFLCNQQFVWKWKLYPISHAVPVLLRILSVLETGSWGRYSRK